MNKNGRYHGSLLWKAYREGTIPHINRQYCKIVLSHNLFPIALSHTLVPFHQSDGKIINLNLYLKTYQRVIIPHHPPLFLIVTIEFKSMASAHDSCSYHQAKTPIDFWCRRDLNLGPLLDDKRLYQLSQLEPTPHTSGHPKWWKSIICHYIEYTPKKN